MKEFELKPGMMLGVASSATQIDGGNFSHTWGSWYQGGHVKGGANPAIACDHWNRWRGDVMLMHQMGIQTYRFSIEWARVEPQEGVFDEAAICRIKEEVMLLIAVGIKPLATLHHFTNPTWFEEKGGWVKEENISFFIRYAQKIVNAMGHLVKEYITINEPNTYALNGYYTGSWPPGQKKSKTAVMVMSVMAQAHIKTYRLIHDIRRSMGFADTEVSVALGMRIFEPKNELSPMDRTSCKRHQNLFQDAIAKAMVTGEFTNPLRSSGKIRKRLYCDFHAINYFSRSVVSGRAESTRVRSNKSDLGTEILPSGIVKCCRFMESLAPLPIYITANGVCDNEDAFRSKFIYDHLQALCASNVDVSRYYYWSFMDSFEWNEGTRAKYGLVHTNFVNLERTVKDSGRFYEKIIRNKKVTEEMYDEYVASQQYHG